MIPLVLVCAGCGVRVRTTRPEVTRTRACPRCRAPLASATVRLLATSGPPSPPAPEAAVASPAPDPHPSSRRWGVPAAVGMVALISFVVSRLGDPPVPTSPGRIAGGSTTRVTQAKPAPRLGVATTRPAAPPGWESEPVGTPPRAEAPAVPPPPVAEPPPPPRPALHGFASTTETSRRPEDIPPPPRPADAPVAGPVPRSQHHRPQGRPAVPPRPEAPDEPLRVRVGDDSGRTMVARAYGGEGARAILLPDGQLAEPEGLVPTDEPFRPATADELRAQLLAGPYAGFEAVQRPHYLVLSNGSAAFARDSASLLESLYKGLLKALGERGVAVREAEFPLVAIIYATEREYRARKPVAPDIHAYYEISSNRIFLYETPTHDEGPEVLLRRRPQVVAHEGTHQVLQNIGVQPRLAAWPPWLIEGLAEFCAPTATKRGEWAGLNKVNPFHMATLRDLADPLSLQLEGPGLTRPTIGRGPDASGVEAIVTCRRLNPTDYALAWALTHYLFNQRRRDFLDYLRQMSRMPPLRERTPEDHLASFRAAFGPDLRGMDRRINAYLAKLAGYEVIPYYAVMFEQPTGRGRARRGTLVSQSPSVILQWVDQLRDPRGGPPRWQAQPFDTRARAFLATQAWINSH
jgi:hypothetical protein